MKKIYSLLLLLSATLGFAQTGIPPGYYSTATGTGYTLKTQLYNIIKNHIDNGYGSGSSSTNNGLWSAYGTTDRDRYYENDNSILDMYSENPNGTDPYVYSFNSNQCGSYSGEGSCYNREHIVPQSVFASANPMHNDPHFIPPTDGEVNNRRNDYPHGMVGSTVSWTSMNGSKLGNALNSGYAAGYSGIVFEPLDAFKGDIARMYLYFATCYENFVAGYTYPMFNGTSNQVFTNTFIEILKHWHQLDPVSQREIDRNNAIYALQNNRNPYIDHPEWVAVIWGPTLSTENFDAIANIAIYPNPSNDHRINITSEVELNEIQLININGQVIQMIKNPNRVQNSYTLENLPQGFYFVKLSSADNQTTTKKILVN